MYNPAPLVVLVRNRCGCRLRLDQLEETGPNKAPQLFELELCATHKRYAFFIAAAETDGITVEINRAAPAAAAAGGA